MLKILAALLNHGLVSAQASFVSSSFTLRKYHTPKVQHSESPYWSRRGLLYPGDAYSTNLQVVYQGDGINNFEVHMHRAHVAYVL